jgi:tetratricopeptide (TPR) repeat protein
VNDLKLQNNGRPSRLARLFRYRALIFLATMAVISLGLALYLTGGFQKRQDIKTDASPSPLNTSTGSAPSPASPISPLLPVSPIATLTESADLDPPMIVSMVQSGMQLHQSGNDVQALQTLNTVLKADPYNSAAYDLRGTIYTALDDYERALSDYDRAIELDPFFAQAHYNRGRIYSLLKRYDEALADLQMSVKLDVANFGYRANGNVGLIYHKQGQYDKALAAFDASIASSDAQADAFYLRGETYTALEEYEAAIADYQSAISRFARYDLAYQGLGYVYYKTAQYDKAAEALNQAVGISPNSPTAHLYLVLVDVATDKPDSAAGEVSRAAAAFSTLPLEEQQSLYSRVTADLKAVAQQNPRKAKEVESIIAGLPQPK